MQAGKWPGMGEEGDTHGCVVGEEEDTHGCVVGEAGNTHGCIKSEAGNTHGCAVREASCSTLIIFLTGKSGNAYPYPPPLYFHT